MLEQVVIFNPEGVPLQQIEGTRRLFHNSLEEFLGQVRTQLQGLQKELGFRKRRV
jgi:hypothetical protein